MQVRPIRPDEAALFTDAADMLTRTWASGASRPEWSFVAEQHGEVIARLAVRTTTDNRWVHEVRPFCLNASLSSPIGAEAARELFRAALAAAAAGGATHFARGVEQDWPESAEQCDLLRGLGIPEVMTKLRFWGDKGAVRTDVPSTLAGRPFTEVGDAAVIALLAEIMSHSLDGVDAVNRREMGSAGAAEHLLLDVRAFDHEPDWFQVAYAGDEPVGLYCPVQMGEYGNVGFIGVRPAHRGRGYIHELLAATARRLFDTGLDGVTADTDSANAPMIAAFTRAGYEPESPARYFQVRLADLNLGG